jgi:hypothetical protein
MVSLSDPYYGLLSNPPGQYGRVKSGHTAAVTLTGSPEFRTRAYNLFASFGGETRRVEWVESRLPIVRKADRPDTDWFYLPLPRIEGALRLYFYGQLWQAKGVKRVVVDEDGDYVETICDNEAELWDEAGTMAARFVTEEMRSDWDAIPDDDWVTLPNTEFSLGAACDAELPVGLDA